MPQIDNWSIPPFQTGYGEEFTTQCWGPMSKPLYGCDERWQDGVMCWGTFESKYCNEVDRYPMVNPLSRLAPIIDVANAASLTVYPQTRGIALSQYALSRQPPVTTALLGLSSQCFGDPGMSPVCADSLGDGVVAGAQFKNCLNNSV